MTKKKTHQQYEEDLLNKEIDAFPVELYKGSTEHILHECVEGHQWQASPNMILSGSSCPTCSTKRLRKGDDQFIQELIDKDISHIPLQPYVTKKLKIDFECIEGHVFSATPSNILNNMGCPECSRVKKPGGYNFTRFRNDRILAESPGILYCIVLVNTKTSERECIKIGITKGCSNKDVLKRAKGFKGYEPRIQKLVHGTLENVFILEQTLHEKWFKFRYLDSHKFAGHTELFEISQLGPILESIPSTV